MIEIEESVTRIPGAFLKTDTGKASRRGGQDLSIEPNAMRSRLIEIRSGLGTDGFTVQS
jgi:hypothetical protein